MREGFDLGVVLSSKEVQQRIEKAGKLVQARKDGFNPGNPPGIESQRREEEGLSTGRPDELY